MPDAFTVKSPAAVGRVVRDLAEAGAEVAIVGANPWGFDPRGPADEVALEAALATERARALALTLRLDPDPSPMCPSEADGTWVLYSFTRDHSGTRTNLERRHDSWLKEKLAKLRPEEPGAFVTDGKPQAWLRAKLKAGLAWPLHISASNTEPWRIGEREGRDVEGWLIWEEPSKNMGAKTKETRRKDAEAFLAEWNAWATGGVYLWHLTDANGEDVAEGNAAGTDAGLEYISSEIRAAVKGLGEGAHIARVVGAAEWLGSSLDVGPVGKPGIA